MCSTLLSYKASYRYITYSRRDNTNQCQYKVALDTTCFVSMSNIILPAPEVFLHKGELIAC